MWFKGGNQFFEALLYFFSDRFAPKELVVRIEIEGELLEIMDQIIVLNPGREYPYVTGGALQQGLGHGMDRSSNVDRKSK